MTLNNDLNEKKRRDFIPGFKSKVAIEALMERYSLCELAERFELHPNRSVSRNRNSWKNPSDVFDKKKDKSSREEVDLDKLYTKIGKLEVERGFFKKA